MERLREAMQFDPRTVLEDVDDHAPQRASVEEEAELTAAAETLQGFLQL